MMKFPVATTLTQVVQTRNFIVFLYGSTDHSTGVGAHAGLAMCFYLRRSHIGT